MLGGAAVTEELFPGFRFSVFSYVVSLLRPEIIRELDLPRHGLDILPARRHVHPGPDGHSDAPKDGNGNPIGTGDYLWRVNDHGRHGPRAAPLVEAATPRRTRNTGRSWSTWPGSSSRSSAIVPPDPASIDPRGRCSRSPACCGASRS